MPNVTGSDEFRPFVTDDLSTEVEGYLSDSSPDLSSLNAYPHFKELCVLLNS